ncbi:patatin-like phospholipase family protein [Shewanella sp. HL-SH2]|uniref:patatin-like phospholipase family protein n=1 Tax=Shewanella sp. HL-SH2 TaxID=3436238 RepID=UPI003EC0199F
MKNYKNLVFEGGGVKGAAYAGAMRVLGELGLYDNVSSLAGTSAGSITASILACGASPEELIACVKSTHFADFISDRGGVLGDFARLASHYGIHTGDGFTKIIKQQIGQTSGDENLTFSSLNKLSKQHSKFKDLYVVATNLSSQTAQIFSYKNSPDLPIWKAVRASISIPFVFEPFEINGELFVDGGLSWNYPIDIFDREGCDFDQTLGFFLEAHNKYQEIKELKTSHENIDSLKSYINAVSVFMYEKANSGHIHQRDQTRTVFIDDLGVSGANFKTSESEILKLEESGANAMKAFLKDIKC